MTQDNIVSKDSLLEEILQILKEIREELAYQRENDVWGRRS